MRTAEQLAKMAMMAAETKRLLAALMTLKASSKLGVCMNKHIELCQKLLARLLLIIQETWHILGFRMTI